MSRLQLALVFLFSIWFVGCRSASTPATTVPPPTVVVEPTAILTAEATRQPTKLVVTEAAEPTAPETSAPGTSEGTLSPETLAEIDSFLSSAYDGKPFQGTVLVARNGEVLLRKGVGMADHSAGIPNGPVTKFRLLADKAFHRRCCADALPPGAARYS